MNRLSKIGVGVLVLGATAAISLAPLLVVPECAEARSQYKKQWKADYGSKVKESCKICHPGKSKKVRRRYACPTFLRQTFHEFASWSIRYSEWARAHYQLLRDRGHKHHAAIRALAFKWIRIIFACWLRRVPYDEQVYIQALRDRGSPVAQYLKSIT